MRNTFLIAFLLALLFFILAFATLQDYGTSWDETIHFRRGQAYLHYFLTGQKTYNLPNYNLQGTQGDPQKVPTPRRSFYQNDTHNGEFFLKQDVGHPPINGELAAFSNYVFYQKMGIMDDVSAHHLFNILASALLVFCIVFFAARFVGIFPAIVSFLALVSYPLFWAESHFNIKDPAEAAFFTATILTFVLFLQEKKNYLIILSSVFFALGLGTKFNILFLPPILAIYLMIRFKGAVVDLSWFSKKYLTVFIIGILLTLTIFVGSWPYLWQKWPQNLFNILNFYQGIGIGSGYQPEQFFVLGINTYPLQWILFTTPPLLIVLFVLGLYSIFVNKGLKDKIGYLWLIWLIIPIIRVSIPGTTIYGGIRQILEFLPAFVLISGLGAWQITQWLKQNKRYSLVCKVLIILAFLWPIFILIKLHPYQNVYFNSLIGTLKGAQERNFPSWGNSLGGAYKGGVEWINQNVEKGAKLALIQGTPSNVPPIFLRQDIDYLVNSDISTNFSHFSGIKREGEYLMELTFDDTGKDFYYAWEYVDSFLEPVYQLKVDGVAILKIWKNDLERTKEEKKISESLYKGKVDLTKEGNVVNIQLAEEQVISHFQINLNNEQACLENLSAVVDTSLDKTNWVREKSVIPEPQINRKSNLEGNAIDFYMAGRKAKYIKLLFNKDACLIGPKLSIFTF